jgi:hypothetical protein
MQRLEEARAALEYVQKYRDLSSNAWGWKVDEALARLSPPTPTP